MLTQKLGNDGVIVFACGGHLASLVKNRIEDNLPRDLCIHNEHIAIPKLLLGIWLSLLFYESPFKYIVA